MTKFTVRVFRSKRLPDRKIGSQPIDTIQISAKSILDAKRKIRARYKTRNQRIISINSSAQDSLVVTLDGHSEAA